MAQRRRPKGYLGIDHETVGSDILAVLKILKLPEQILGADLAGRLSAIEPRGWYPIELLLDVMDKLDSEVGHYGLLRMGRALFNLSHEARVGKVATCARDIVYGINDMYRHSNRGRMIGGWEVLTFEPGNATLEKTTPHHCIMEQGILSAALSTVGCPGIVSQSQCFREGADACHYVVSSSFIDERWNGVKL
ncbi:MAG TPA: hypothetical protein VNW92_12190 [Polyangiaceae bacterium]|jgi:hypothetical protein|nr:hypothetical protein [Polyangiaceae bacterium]